METPIKNRVILFPPPMSSSKSRQKSRAKSKAAPPPVKPAAKVAASVVATPVGVEAPAPPIKASASAPSDKFWYGATGVMVLAIILRQVQLGASPFHPDETIHAFFSYGFDTYHYDPVYHGPLLYHLTSMLFALFGQYDYVARLAPSLLGIGLVAMILGPARRWMGPRASLAGAALVAVSPSIVTYSRHLLHDALVLDLTLGAVLCFLTALHHPAKERRGQLALLGLAACLSLFLATKANFFFILVVLLAFWGTWQVAGRAKLSLPYAKAWPVALFALVTFAAIAFPRDNTSPEPVQAAQHRVFQLVAAASCAAFLLWVMGRPQAEPEREAREAWRRGNDWTAWVLALALALWIYVFLFGQGAQVLAQWVATRQFPSTTWASGRDSAQHAISKMLEYWGGQQAKPRLPSRHDYYIVLGILYELPIYVAAMGGIWHAARRRTVWSDFLLWWAFASWAVYAVANEKVPWLLVHLALPLALLGAGWLASLNWRRPAFLLAASVALLFSLRGDEAMIWERAGDHAEPLLYAQTPDAFRDVLEAALLKTKGDGRDIWMDGERQWPSVWYLRDPKFNPIRGTSGTPIAGVFAPEKYRAFIAQDKDLPLLKNKAQWDLQTVDFLIWPRASWTALEPQRFWHWFWTRETIPHSEEGSGPGSSATSILAGQGEWSHATAIVGARKVVKP